MFLKEGKAEVILGIFFAVFGLLLLLVIIPWQIAYVEGGYPQPRFFPNIIAALITVLGAALAIGGFRKVKANKPDQEVYSVEKKQLLLVLLFYCGQKFFRHSFRIVASACAEAHHHDQC